MAVFNTKPLSAFALGQGCPELFMPTSTFLMTDSPRSTRVGVVDKAVGRVLVLYSVAV